MKQFDIDEGQIIPMGWLVKIIPIPEKQEVEGKTEAGIILLPTKKTAKDGTPITAGMFRGVVASMSRMKIPDDIAPFKPQFKEKDFVIYSKIAKVIETKNGVFHLVHREDVVAVTCNPNE